MPTYTVYPSSSHSHRSRPSRHSYSGHGLSPSYSGSHRSYAPSYVGSHSGHSRSGNGSHGGYYGGGSGYNAYDTGARGHQTNGHSSSGYYHSNSSSYPQAHTAQYPYTSGQGSYGYASTHQNYGRSHGRSQPQPQYYVPDSRSQGHHYSHGYKPSIGQRLKWMFGMNNRNYHDSGKGYPSRSRSVHDSGRRHDDRGRHIYTV